MISVAIPFFNNEKTLELAIRSVFAQTWVDWELIVLDDGSTDKSLEMVRQLNDKRVSVFSDGQNKGLVARLNQAVQLAKGDLFARMDADDLMHPDRLALQAACLGQRSEVQLTGTATFVIDDQNHPVGWRDLSSRSKGPDGKPSGVLHPTVTGRTSWFRSNPYDPRYPRAEDIELWTRTRAFTVVAPLPERLFFYRDYGCFNINKYVAGSRSVRRVIRKYGPQIAGAGWTCRQIGLSYAKAFLYRAYYMAGQEHRLLRSRNQHLQPDDELAAVQIIERIKNTAVPGWPHHSFGTRELAIE